MQEVVLNVAPTTAGWSVDCNLPLEPAFFLSAESAEQMAKSLALRLADIGQDVRLLIANSHNEPVATHCFFSL